MIKIEITLERHIYEMVGRYKILNDYRPNNKISFCKDQTYICKSIEFNHKDYGNFNEIFTIILNSNKYLYHKNNKERIHILREMKEKNVFNQIDNLIKCKTEHSNLFIQNYKLNTFYFDEKYCNSFVEYNLEIKIIFF